MKKIILPIASILLFTGCKSTLPEHSLEGVKKNTFKYEAIGKEEFVFSEIPDVLQKYGYNEFCKYGNAYSSCHPDDILKYEDYLGKKAYLTSREKRSKVIVENGDTVYFYGGNRFEFNEREGYIRTSNLQGDYNPEGKEEFIITSKPYAVCREPSKRCFNLNEDNQKSLIGKKGYFDEREFPEVSYGHKLLPITLEDGQRFYFDKKSDSALDGAQGLLSMDRHLENLNKQQERDNFKPEPLHPNSKIMIIKYHDKWAMRQYTLSNGETIFSDKLSLIREISKLPTYKPVLDEYLIRFVITKDKFENIYFISPFSTQKSSYVKFYIGLSEHNSWLRLNIKYISSNWLFIKNFKILANGERWLSQNYNFERDHDGGTIWEWIDIPVEPNDKIFQVFKSGLSANDFTIRFNGDKYYDDFYPNKNKVNLEIMTLYDAIK